MNWHHAGRAFYVTGGTTKSPRLIGYDSERWRRAISAKARLLTDYGISSDRRLAICTPFSPWSIGQVFLDAALSLGAQVFPIGLSSSNDSMLDLLREFAPTDICGGVRHVTRMGIRLQQRGGKIGLDRNAVIFVAGEQLTSVDRSLCEKVWDARVVDVYGMAEFDMVGFETASQPGEFSLIPEFGYALLPEQGLPLTSPAIGTIGELLIRAESQAAWHRTGDRVVVKSDFAVERKWRVCFVGRLNESVTLADGTTITSEHVDTLQQSLGFQFVQVIVERGQVADLIRIRVPEDQSRPCSEVETAFANANIDLADAVFYGVAKFRVEFIASGSLTRTPRGKVPRIMMGDSA